MGGVISTILLGSIGFIYLSKSRQSVHRLVGFVFALFWFREIISLFRYLVSKLTTQKIITDEQAIASYFKVSPLILLAVLSVIALIVLYKAVFIIRSDQIWCRIVLVGPIAVICGGVIWFKIFGPYLFP